MPNTHITDTQVDDAIERIGKIVEAAMNSNQAGEDALICADSATALLKSLQELEALFRRPDEHYTESFERIAADFERATGYLRPGKDCIMHSPELRKEKWDAWIAKRLDNARTAIARARGERE